jgi:hypothetical protein
MRYSATPLRPHIGHVVANPPYSTERRRDGCRVNVTLLKHEPMFVYHMPDSMYELQSTFERLFHEERNHRNITDLLAGKPEELVHKDLTKYEDVAEKMRIGYVWNGTVRAPPVLDDEGLARGDRKRALSTQIHTEIKSQAAHLLAFPHTLIAAKTQMSFQLPSNCSAF